MSCYVFYKLTALTACTVVVWVVITGWCRLENPNITSSVVTESKNSWNGWRDLCHPGMINAGKALIILLKCQKSKYFSIQKSFRLPVAEFDYSWVGLRFLLFNWVFADRWPLVVLIKTTYAGLCSNWGNTEGLGKKIACQNLVSVYMQLIPSYSKLSLSFFLSFFLQACSVILIM